MTGRREDPNPLAGRHVGRDLTPEQARAWWQSLDDRLAAEGLRWDGRMLVPLEKS